MDKQHVNELEGLEKVTKAKIHIDSLKTTLKKYPIGKLLAMIEYWDFDAQKALPFVTDLQVKWIDAYKKQTCLN